MNDVVFDSWWFENKIYDQLLEKIEFYIPNLIQRRFADDYYHDQYIHDNMECHWWYPDEEDLDE